MITERQYLNAIKIVKAYQQQINEQVDSLVPKTERQIWRLEDLPLKFKSYNAIIKAIDIAIERKYKATLPFSEHTEKKRELLESTVKDIANYITIKDIEAGRNTGKRTIEEVIKVFSECGLTFALTP